MTVVAFDEADALVQTWERAGARYLWQITVDVEAETVTFYGQSSGLRAEQRHHREAGASGGVARCTGLLSADFSCDQSNIACVMLGRSSCEK